MGSDEVTDYRRKMRKGRESKAGRWWFVCDGRMAAADEVREFQIFEGEVSDAERQRKSLYVYV